MKVITREVEPDRASERSERVEIYYMPYFVYILECSNKALYVGITTDLQRRLKQHQTGEGGHYTSYNPGKRIRYYEKHGTRSKATKREMQIKRWSRTKKLALIKGEKSFLKAASRCRSR